MTDTVLRVDGSMRREGSQSRALADRLLEQMAAQKGPLEIIERDLSEGVPFVDAPWIGANLTPPEQRTPDQRSVLAASDALIGELRAADTLVLATPIYNFGVPAAVKAWIDMVARARETFRYASDGPEGLLKGKKAYVIVVSGGTVAESEIDFATPYLRHVLSFIGLTDVTFITANGKQGGEALMAEGARRIAALAQQAA